MKYRIERERTDHGYGAGWVVLDPTGEAVHTCLTQQGALGWARIEVYVAATGIA